MGIITDRKSPRLAAIIGMFALFAGYYLIKLGMAVYKPRRAKQELTRYSI